VWKTIATHMPFTYTSDVITRVVHSGLVSGTGLSRVSPTAPSASQSLIAIAIYSAVVVALMLLAVSKRDVTA
ncbi:MAG: hypothetical protein ACRDQH_06525, partial [Pseudonocardiaceae bacterium]